MGVDELSKLTNEGKQTYRELLGMTGGDSGSSFTAQLETTEGLTLGVGTDDEVTITAAQLKALLALLN